MIDIRGADAGSLSDEEIDSLVAEEKLLRILRPDVREQVWQSLGRSNEVQQYVVVNGGHLYISLAHIGDEAERDRFYRLIQRHQSGEKVDLHLLPQPICQILQPELTCFGRFLGGVLLGLVVGIGTGLLAMALVVVLRSAVEGLVSQEIRPLQAIDVTAVSFIVFTCVGWGTAAVVAWLNPQLWQKWGDATLWRRRK